MTSLASLFALEALGPFIWRSSVLIALAYLLNGTAFRRCPTHRYLTLLSVLLLLPVVWATATMKLSVPEFSAATPVKDVLETPDDDAAATKDVAGSAAAISAYERVVAVELPRASARWNAPGDWIARRGDAERGGVASFMTSDRLLGAWAIGVLLSGVVLWRRLRSLDRLLTGARPVTDERLLCRFAMLARRLGAPDTVRLLAVDGLSGPAAARVRRPVVMIPTAMVRAPADDLDATLAHELLHHRRRDPMLRLVEIGVRAVVWFHPLVHLLSRSIAAEREHAIDLAVVVAVGDADGYVEQLLETARRALARRGVDVRAAVPFFARASSLRRRIAMLLSHTRYRTSRHPVLFALAVSAVFGLVATFFLVGGAPRAAAAAGEERVVDTNVVSIDEKGRYRPYLGLSSVSKVTLDGQEIDPDTGWSFDAASGILEVKVEVGSAMGLRARGVRSIPWAWTLPTYGSGGVTVVIDDRVAVPGTDFDFDESTGTLRFRKAEDCGDDTKFYISYSRGDGISVGLGNHPNASAVLEARGTKQPVTIGEAAPTRDGLDRARVERLGENGDCALSIGMADVVEVATWSRDGTEPDRSLVRGRDWTFDASRGVLTLSAGVDAGKADVFAFGTRAVPWSWTVEGLDPSSVKALIGDRVAERGRDFEVDTASNTVRFLRAEDCTTSTPYYVSCRYTMPTRPNDVYSRSFSNQANEDAIRRLQGLPISNVDGVDPSRLVPTGTWTTDRENVFVPYKRMLGRGLQLSINRIGGAGEKRFLDRGEEFVFDESSQRVALIGGTTVDRSDSIVMAWGVPMDETGATFQFPDPIDPATVKILVNETLIGAGTGYVIDRDANTVTITAAGLAAGRDPNHPNGVPRLALKVGELELVNSSTPPPKSK